VAEKVLGMIFVNFSYSNIYCFACKVLRSVAYWLKTVDV